MKHIVIDARIRPSSTGKPVDKLLEYLQKIDTKRRYTVLMKPDDDWQPHAKNFSVQKTRYPIFSFNPLNQILYTGQLNRLKADLVYFTLTPQQPLFYRKPFMTFTHDLGMLKYARAGNLPEWAHKARMLGYRILMRSAHKNAIRVIAPTRFVADDINKYHLATNRKTVVMLEAGDPATEGMQKPKHTPKQFIMYTGSAFPHKNLNRLISAFQLLRKQQPSLHLILIGKREKYSRDLETWAQEHDLADNITFTGFIPDGELAWYYQNARAYVFASLNEGFGLPGLEAMAYGCPVASSDAASLPEVHGDAALYFDPTHVTDMADKIGALISNENTRQRLIKKGHANAKKFSWKRFAQQHVDLFTELEKNSEL